MKWLLCLPIQIKTKYYPIVLILLFSLLNGSPGLDMIMGALVGYLHFAYLDKKYFQYLNDSRMQRWEQIGLCAWFRTQSSMIIF